LKLDLGNDFCYERVKMVADHKTGIETLYISVVIDPVLTPGFRVYHLK